MCTVTLICAQLRCYVHSYVDMCTVTFICTQLLWYVHSYFDIAQLLSRSIQTVYPEELE